MERLEQLDLTVVRRRSVTPEEACDQRSHNLDAAFSRLTVGLCEIALLRRVDHGEEFGVVCEVLCAGVDLASQRLGDLGRETREARAQRVRVRIEDPGNLHLGIRQQEGDQLERLIGGPVDADPPATHPDSPSGMVSSWIVRTRVDVPPSASPSTSGIRTLRSPHRDA